jgi:hypothetical protein
MSLAVDKMDGISPQNAAGLKRNRDEYGDDETKTKVEDLIRRGLKAYLKDFRPFKSYETPPETQRLLAEAKKLCPKCPDILQIEANFRALSHEKKL